ncbi:MAG: S1C family serine protease [Bacteroidetes bacterium]|nr:S1C family serine protease [Bacteroidota bacterium]
MKKIIYFLSVLFLLSGCASVFNGKYQEVTILTNDQNKVYINGDSAKMINGKYLLKRDRIPKEITVKREGYKDENITIMQYKKSPLYILSCFPFGILVYPMLYDNGKNAWDYDGEINIGGNMKILPPKEVDAKEIRLNNVNIDLKEDSVKYRYFSTYKSFKQEEKTKTGKSDENERVKIGNTIFSDILNTLLKEKGYIDTTKKMLKDNYLDNLLIDAVITDYTYHYVDNYYSVYYDFSNSNGGMIFVDLTINWKALDFYKKPIYSISTKVRSGQFSCQRDNEKDVVYKAIKDAMEFGLIDFMNSKEVNQLLHDKSQQKVEESFEEIILPKSDKYANNLSDAVKSSVTLKCKNGHGSGFLISDNGYILTNYHVISDTSGLKVIMYNDTVYDVKVIRYSKIYDLALLKIEAKGLISLKISQSPDIDVASEIYAIGTPLAEDLSQTISKGIISAVRKISETSKIIQTDASVNAGNSGGAIVNKNGMVIGIVSSKLKAFGIEGVAFGIPAFEIFDKLKINFK